MSLELTSNSSETYFAPVLGNDLDRTGRWNDGLQL